MRYLKNPPKNQLDNKRIFVQINVRAKDNIADPNNQKTTAKTLTLKIAKNYDPEFNVSSQVQQVQFTGILDYIKLLSYNNIVAEEDEESAPATLPIATDRNNVEQGEGTNTICYYILGKYDKMPKCQGSIPNALCPLL